MNSDRLLANDQGRSSLPESEAPNGMRLYRLLQGLRRATLAAQDAGYGDWAETLQHWTHELAETLGIKEGIKDSRPSEMWLG
ncbi:MAG: hypothetical protein H5T69_08255 [Chloroflexi bacterium]|nr:hypothetical protein [Chloroflexota bacterium]